MNTTDIGRTANSAVTQSKSFLNRQVDARTTDLGNRVSSTASDLRRIAGDLEQSQTVSGAADLANYGADVVDRVGGYLRDADGERLVADLEEFARRQPWTVATGAFVAGLALSRLLKASSSRRFQSTYGANDYANAGYGNTTYGTGTNNTTYGTGTSGTGAYGATTGSYGSVDASPGATGMTSGMGSSETTYGGTTGVRGTAAGASDIDR